MAIMNSMFLKTQYCPPPDAKDYDPNCKVGVYTGLNQYAYDTWVINLIMIAQGFVFFWIAILVDHVRINAYKGGDHR